MRRRYLLAAVLVVLLSSSVALAALRPSQTSGCPPFFEGSLLESKLAPTSFGAVTTFSLPAPDRWPNAIAVATDGSVWFGEEAVPALAHLFPSNETLIEYPFPGPYSAKYSQGYDCSDKSDIWGVALWDGRVWATDSAQNRLVGLSATNDTFKVVPLAAPDSEPYTLTPGPDGALWFTQINSGQVGTLFVNGTVEEHFVRVPEYVGNASAPVYVPGVPAQIAFANVTTGYYVDASPLIAGSAVFSFDPEQFDPTPVGGNQTLADPTSIALGDGGIWLAQHGDSSLARYDRGAGSWTIYPTSRVSYIGTTLPYFVNTNGSLVWFNEHFGNRMAALDVPNGTLTEYSVSDPPSGNMSQLGNVLTSAIGGSKAWFTESTADAVGFVDASYQPSFSISLEGNSSLSVQAGGTNDLNVDLRGSSSTPLSINFSDSARTESASSNITLLSDKAQVGPFTATVNFNVKVEVSPGTLPGTYALLVTASDGLISRSVYVALTVLS